MMYSPELDITKLLTPRKKVIYLKRPDRFVEEIIFNTRAAKFGGDLEISDQQREMLLSIVDNRRVSAKAGRGVGKGHPLSAKLPTPSGMTLVGDLKIGDYVFGADGYPTEVTDIFDRGVLDVYKVTFDDGSVVICDGDHLWNVKGRQERRNDRDWITLDTRTLVEKGIKNRFKSGREDRVWEVPTMTNPAQFDASEVEIDPYTLGVWLGDGSVNKGQITNIDMEVIDHISEVYNIRQAKYDDQTWIIDELFTKLKKLGVSHKRAFEKSIPDSYKYNSEEVRFELLRGLLDTDGWVSKSGTVQYGSTSKQLFDDVVEVARSLGLKVYTDRKVKHPFYYGTDGDKIQGRDFYICSISYPPNTQLFHISRKQDRLRTDTQYRYYGKKWIELIEKIGQDEVRCITVAAEDSLYLTDDYVVTHNTAVLAWLIIWWESMFEGGQTVVSAPSFPQLMSVIWPEVAKWLKISLVSEFFTHTAKKLYLKSDPKNTFAEPRTASKEESAQGLHEEHLLILLDEAPGIEDKIWDVLQGSLTKPNNKVFAMGNPSRTSGFFYDAFHKDKKIWYQLTFNSEDSPNVDESWLDEMREKYVMGETYHDMYRVHVLGQFPSGDPDAFIQLEEVDKARYRDVPKEGIIEIGVDVARKGDDLTCIAVRYGNYIDDLITMNKVSIDMTVNKVLSVVDEIRDTTGYSDVIRIKVDDTGVGAGVTDYLSIDRERNIEVVPCNFGGKGDANYSNEASKMWGTFKDMLPQLRLPDNRFLLEELSTRKWELDSRGRILIQRKKDFKKDFGSSPDHADAVILCTAQKENELRLIKSYDYVENGKSYSAADLMHGDMYASIYLDKKGVTSAVITTFTGSSLRVVDEYIGDTSEIVGVLNSYGPFKKIIGSKNMFHTGADDIFLDYLSSGINLSESYGYDEYGATRVLEKMAKRDGLITARECERTATQLRTWTVSDDSRSRRDEYGLCMALLHIVSELTQQNMVVSTDISVDNTYNNSSSFSKSDVNSGFMSL